MAICYHARFTLLAVARYNGRAVTGIGARAGGVLKGGGEMTKIAVIGSGAWGTTLARLVATAPQDGGAGARVTLYEHRPERAAEMEQARENHAFLPGFSLPDGMRVTADLGAALAGAEIVVMVTPSQRMREQARLVAPLLAPGALVV